MPLDNTTKTKRITIAPLTEEELAAARAARSGGKKPQVVRVTRPRMTTAAIKIVGTSAYVQHAFSEKQRKQMELVQQAGQQARGRKVREPKDFNAVFEAAKHVSTEGWLGVPAPAFRNACISACKLCGIVMTRAKLSIFIVADGIDREDGTPLVRIIGDKDQPHIHRASVRNESGVADVRWRPMWDAQKWRCTVHVRWDEDQFSAEDVMNLMWRAGEQVGIGEGRADSPNSNGLGWGHFSVVE